MRVLGLCDELARVARFARDVGPLDGVDFEALVCNNRRLGALRFRAGVAAQLATMPGADQRIVLALLARRRLRISRHALHDPPVLRWLQKKEYDVGLHAAGVIYRRPLLQAFRRGVLNAHIGILPAYRGRSVMEWSILHGDETGVSVFFMDEGIDTGPEIVLREAVPVTGKGNVAAAKEHLFDQDARMYRRALERVARHDYEPEAMQAAQDGTRYYVMSELLKEVVDGLIRR